MNKLLVMMPMLIVLLSLVACSDSGNVLKQPIITETLPPISLTESQEASLSALKTPYVGNASAVSKIIQVLYIPACGWQQRFMSVGDNYDSSFTPYTLTVYYEPTDLDAAEAMLEEMQAINAVFERNAAILFALIGNLEEVTFAVRLTPSDNIFDNNAYEHHWSITKDSKPE